MSPPRWTHPLPLWQADVARWRLFSRLVVARIDAIRATEGIGLGESWQTFETPLPSLPMLRVLPAGRLVEMSPRTTRDRLGRFAVAS